MSDNLRDAFTVEGESVETFRLELFLKFSLLPAASFCDSAIVENNDLEALIGL